MSKIPLNGLGIVGRETLKASISAGADSLTMAEIKESTEDIINRAKAENLPMVYILKEQYAKIDPAIIHQKEAEFHCVLVPVEEHEMQRIKDDSVPYTMPPKIPDIKMLSPAVYDLPHVKGGRYHEPPRDLKKKKKAKRRMQKQSRRRN
jgi:hypothetical protein